MKKLFKTALIGIASLLLVACGGKKEDGGKSEDKSEEESVEPCTVHEDGYTGWFLTGPDVITVDGVHASENKGAEWDFGGDSFELQASTVEAVKALDATLGETLEAKGELVKGVYMLEKVGMGLEHGGWSARFKDEEGIKIANCSFVAKIIKTKYNAEDDVWATQQWTPDPKTAHVENLGNYFCPTWQEEADEDGFAWDQNPVVTGGAGIYTVVFVEYAQSSSADNFGFGTAFIKTEAKEGEEYELEPKEHTYGLVGTINGWGNDGADIAMTVSEDGETAVATYDFPADSEWKVRLDSDWATSYGWDNLKEAPENAFADPGNGNIKTAIAGNYKVTLTIASGDINIEAVA